MTSDRNEAMQKQFLKRAVSGTEWALYADKQAPSRQLYHHYADSLFSTICTVIKQDEDKQEKTEHILYVRQERYGMHPSSKQ